MTIEVVLETTLLIAGVTIDEVTGMMKIGVGLFPGMRELKGAIL